MLWVRLAGLKWGPVPGKGEDADAVAGDMIIREGRENEEICVEWSLGPRSFDSAAWHDLSHSALSDSTLATRP